MAILAMRGSSRFRTGFHALVSARDAEGPPYSGWKPEDTLGWKPKTRVRQILAYPISALAIDRELLIRLQNVRDVIAETLDERLTLATLADQAFLSPFHFHRTFARVYGETPHEFLTRQRNDLAKKLLAENQLSISEICLAVGFQSLGTFSDRFRRLTGLSPTEYRRRLIFHFAYAPIRSHRFVPYCFVSQRAISPNRKIEEASSDQVPLILTR